MNIEKKMILGTSTQLWEGAKAVLRWHIIAFKKRQKQQKQKTLEQQIQCLEEKYKDTIIS